MESSSYFNTIAFLLTTLFYSMVMRPELKLEQMSAEEYPKYKANNYLYLGAYLLLILVVQFSVNSSIISNNCGGSMKENVGAAGPLTFIPWLLIFGVMMLILVIYPGFKSAFSDVVGYFVVSGGAKDIFDAIMNTDLQKEINTAKDKGESTDGLEKAVQALTKMVDNNQSILINKMTPDNFADFWTTMRPLMKPTITNTISIENDYKTQMLNLVVLKDNIGEAIWYVYTALLISSIVYYNLANVGCKKSVEQIKASHDEYVQQQQEADQKAALNNAVQTSLS